MVKTKRTVRTAKKTAAAPIASKKGATCEGSCWLCWLFKIMIAIFILMVVFWLGFCFGAISAYTPTAKVQPGNMSYGNALTTPKAITGQIFDQDFLSQMILQHRELVDMARLGMEKTSNDGIKLLCQSIIDTHTKVINQLEAWQSSPTSTAAPESAQ